MVLKLDLIRWLGEHLDDYAHCGVPLSLVGGIPLGIVVGIRLSTTKHVSSPTIPPA
jgi:hypothetical protein